MTDKQKYHADAESHYSGDGCWIDEKIKAAENLLEEL